MKNTPFLKRYIAILMTFMILAGTFKDVASFLSFKVNQDYIAEVLCINKDIPESSCHGKCMLIKNIQENHEPNEKSPAPLIEKTQNLIFLIPFQKDAFNHGILLHIQKPPFASRQMIESNYHFDIFHPPQV